MVFYSKYGIRGTLGPVPIHSPSYALVLRPSSNNRSLARVEGDGIAPLGLVLYIFWADLITPQIEITPAESVSL